MRKTHNALTSLVAENIYFLLENKKYQLQRHDFSFKNLGRGQRFVVKTTFLSGPKYSVRIIVACWLYPGIRYNQQAK